MSDKSLDDIRRRKKTPSEQRNVHGPDGNATPAIENELRLRPCSIDATAASRACPAAIVLSPSPLRRHDLFGSAQSCTRSNVIRDVYPTRARGMAWPHRTVRTHALYTRLHVPRKVKTIRRKGTRALAHYTPARRVHGACTTMACSRRVDLCCERAVLYSNTVENVITS